MTILFILLFALLVGLVAWGIDGRFKLGAVFFGFAGVLATAVALILDIFI